MFKKEFTPEEIKDAKKKIASIKSSIQDIEAQMIKLRSKAKDALTANEFELSNRFIEVAKQLQAGEINHLQAKAKSIKISLLALKKNNF